MSIYTRTELEGPFQFKTDLRKVSFPPYLTLCSAPSSDPIKIAVKGPVKRQTHTHAHTHTHTHTHTQGQKITREDMAVIEFWKLEADG